MSEKSTFETVIKWAIIIILAIVALKIVFTVLGVAFVLGSVLLFRVLPLILLVWIVLRVVGWFRGSDGGANSAPDVTDV
jgi:hypothetical protein